MAKLVHREKLEIPNPHRQTVGKVAIPRAPVFPFFAHFDCSYQLGEFMILAGVIPPRCVTFATIFFPFRVLTVSIAPRSQARINTF